jgi:stalled ribosome rescue protein Dom34
MSKHAIVWLDRWEARVFQVHPHTFNEETLSAPAFRIHKHPKGFEERAEHPNDATRFFQDVARALDKSAAVLIVGPSTAKLQFVKYAQEHDAALEARIVGTETMDHPTGRQIVAYARRHFRLN